MGVQLMFIRILKIEGSENLNKDDGDGYVQILPKYTYSNIQASGHRFSRNPIESSKPIEEKKKVSSNEHSIGIGLGYVVDFQMRIRNL